ncbi:MAG: hypothetical protein ABSF96_05990 [Steroidobacteraceae bacterium]|jgi:DNA-directed RNA polymerase sigma subunit (sigma70/sigma32)
MKSTPPELALERILIALERDVIDATEEELMTAARELGMNPSMKGSAAFFGVTEAIRAKVHSLLAALTPQEAKALRAQFGIDEAGRAPDEEEVILRALARDLGVLQKKQ